MAKKTANESILREKTVKHGKAKVRIDSRFKSLRSVSVISIVLVIAICIVANLLLSLTLDDKLTFDTSSVQSNTITSLSKSYIMNLDKQVEIIGLFDRNDTSFEWRDYSFRFWMITKRRPMARSILSILIRMSILLFSRDWIRKESTIFRNTLM